MRMLATTTPYELRYNSSTSASRILSSCIESSCIETSPRAGRCGGFVRELPLLARWKAETNCVGCQFSTTVQIKLPHEILAMFPGGKQADAETVGDVAAGGTV